jgi:hypothetical protein
VNDDIAIRCDRCGVVTPALRFVTFYAVAFGALQAEGMLLCPRCRAVQSRRSALAVLTHNLSQGRPGWPATRDAIRFNLGGGELDPPQNAFVLQHLGAAFAGRGLEPDAAAAYEAGLSFERTDDVAHDAAPMPKARGPFDVATTARRLAIAIAAGVAAGGVGLVLGDAIATLQQHPAARSARAATRDDRPAKAAGAFDGVALAGSHADDVRRRADTAIATAQSAPPSSSTALRGYLYDLPRDRRFAASWRRALERLPQPVRSAHRWLADLETTAAPNVSIRVPAAGRYVIAWGCDPQRCGDGIVLMTYNEQTAAVCAAAYFDGAWHAIGSDSVDDRAVLLVALARQQLHPDRAFPLAHGDADDARRFVAAIRD